MNQPRDDAAASSPDEAVDEQGQNPYDSPVATQAPPPPQPRVLPWVLGCSAAGAGLLGYLELRGEVGTLSEALPPGAGGAVVGGLCGAICGRVIGRLLLAKHSFRMMHHRHAELRDELQERRGK